MAKCYVTVGLPGSGKSTFASSLNIPVFSSDEIRKELYGSEETQKNPERVFKILEQRLISCLKSGRDCVYDATNLTRQHRTKLVARLKEKTPETEFVCLFFDVDPWTAWVRNKNRSRVVPYAAFVRMQKQIEIPQFDEGWNRIDIIKEDGYFIEKIN